MAEPFENRIDSTTMSDPLIGAMLGEYRVLSLLGQGAMGVVYRGEQPVIGKPVAIKVLQKSLGADPVYVKKLLEEARAISAARHPNIIDIFSFGEAPTGQQYFVMECLEGEPLDLYLRQQGGRLPVEEAARLLSQITAGLSAAHAAGVVHRDLKPSNIFLARLGDGTRFVKLLDFGLAKRTAPNSGVRPTANIIVGTALYMAPEQATTEEIGPWTDLYATGCIAHELLTGAPPFSSANIIEVLDRHANVAPTPLRQLDPSIPEAFERLVLELLEKVPAKRPKSAGVVRRALERIERHAAAADTRGSGIKQLRGTGLQLAEAVAPTRISNRLGAPETEESIGPTRLSNRHAPSEAEEAIPPTRISDRLRPMVADEEIPPTHISLANAGAIPSHERPTQPSKTAPDQARLLKGSRTWLLVVLAPLLGVGGYFVARKLDAPVVPVVQAVDPTPVEPAVPVVEPDPPVPPDPVTPPKPTRPPGAQRSARAVADLERRIKLLQDRSRAVFGVDTKPDRMARREIGLIWEDLEHGRGTIDQLSKELDECEARHFKKKLEASP